MAIKVINTKGITDKQGLKIFIFGASGSGKTRTLKSLAPHHKVLLISCEKGEAPLNDSDIDLIQVSDLQELREAYDYANTNKDQYDILAVDGITEISDWVTIDVSSMEIYEDPKMTIKMYGEIKKKLIAILKSFRDIKLETIMLSLDKEEEEGMKRKVYPNITGGAKKSVISLFDMVFYINIKEDGSREFVCDADSRYDCKDRFDVLNRTEPYSKEEGFKPIYDKLIASRDNKKIKGK